jgi:hypothetical protein
VSTPSLLIARFVGMAQKKFIASFARSEPSGCVSFSVSLLPDAVMPLAVFALPSTTACAPTTVLMNGTAGDCISGFRSRLKA